MDVKELQHSLNRFTNQWLENVTPIGVDGDKGHSTNRRIMTVKWYLGYGKRDGEVTRLFVRRLRHPRSRLFSTPTMLATARERRRQQKVHALIEKDIAGFKGAVMYDGKPVPKWMVPWLDKARHHKGAGRAWAGSVVSGVRTPAHSVELCIGICGKASCPGLCAGVSSNHNATPPVEDGEGAIDVTDFVRFGEIMQAIGAPLRNDLPRDRVHFSRTGH